MLYAHIAPMVSWKGIKLKPYLLTILVSLGLSFLASCDSLRLDKLSWCIWGTDVPPTASLAGCEGPWHVAEGCICNSPELTFE